MGYDDVGKHDGNGIKMVPESDLMSIKTGRETDATGHKTALELLQSKLDEAGIAHTAALDTAKQVGVKHQEDAATLRADNAGLATVKTDLETATKSLAEAKTEAETATNSLAESRKSLLDAKKRLMVARGADEAKLVGITELKDLEDIEKAADIYGGNANNSGGDKKTGGAGFFGSAGNSGGEGEKSTGASKVAAGVKASQHLRTPPS